VISLALYHNLASEPKSVDRVLELNCLVLGDGPNHIFQVEIARTKTVAALKEAIKEEKKQAFRDVDADSLKLWAVSIPVDASFEVNVTNFDIDEQFLSPLDELSAVLGSPARKHLHIVVQALRNGECKKSINCVNSNLSRRPFSIASERSCFGLRRRFPDTHPRGLEEKISE
jgi:hypothetical protein